MSMQSSRLLRDIDYQIGQLEYTARYGLYPYPDYSQENKDAMSKAYMQIQRLRRLKTKVEDISNRYMSNVDKVDSNKSRTPKDFENRTGWFREFTNKERMGIVSKAASNG